MTLIYSTEYVLFPIANAQCSIGSESYYGLNSTTAENCCDNKQNLLETSPYVVKKCGQWEGGCTDQDDCLPGYTCRKLNKFMHLSTYSA